MADRRMFSKKITNSARFLKMPLSSQALYFHLGQNADDDGVVEAYTVVQTVGAEEDDLRVLCSKGFVQILNEDLVAYITDWRENNKLRADRKIDSIYKDLLLQIVPDADLLQIQNRADRPPRVPQPLPLGDGTSTGRPVDAHGTAQDRIGEDRIVEDSVVEESIPADEPPHSPAPEKPNPVVRKNYGQYGWVSLSDEEYQRLVDELGESEVLRCITYVDKSAQGNGNKNEWKDWNLIVRRCHCEGWGLNRGGHGKKPHMLTKEENDARRNGADWMMKYVTRPEPKTAGEDPAIRERAEKLQRELKGAKEL